MGLMGTVLGVMDAFIGISSKGSGNIAAVAPGVAEALIATVAGLARGDPGRDRLQPLRQPGPHAGRRARGLRGGADRHDGARGDGLTWAALSGFRGDDDMALNADVNVTSLVDVAFVLLIIFMIAAPMMQGGVDVDLPRAAAKPLHAKQGIVVSLDRQGKIFLDETPVSYRDFRATFRSIVATRKPDAVYLRADNRASYGDVVRVVAIIRNSGVRNLGLVAEDEESK